MLGKPLRRLVVNGFRVEVQDRENGLKLYTRSRVEEGRSVLIVKKMVSGSVGLTPYPIYPIYNPRFITRYILCILDEELILAPRDSMRFYLRFPYDVAIYAEMAGEFRVLDVIPLHSRYKLSFYGHQASGLIARTCRSRVYVEEPEFSVGWGIMPVYVVNETNRLAILGRILLDSSPLKLYYMPGSWAVYTQLVQINISTQSVAVITYGDPIRGDIIPIEDPPEIRPPKIVSTTYMLWGF